MKNIRLLVLHKYSSKTQLASDSNLFEFDDLFVIFNKDDKFSGALSKTIGKAINREEFGKLTLKHVTQEEAHAVTRCFGLGI